MPLNPNITDEEKERVKGLAQSILMLGAGYSGVEFLSAITMAVSYFLTSNEPRGLNVAKTCEAFSENLKMACSLQMPTGGGGNGGEQ